MVQLVILADDLTGAADAGGGFASLGLSTTLVFGDDETGEGTDVLVRSARSRGLPVSEAVARNQELAAALPEHELTYKKIDSMLRGHPCAELGAVLDGRGEFRALVAPALPVERRTTVGGYQRIGSGNRTVDLMATFGCRPDLPVWRIDLWTVQQGAAAVADAINTVGVGLIVTDAVTDADLAAIAGGVFASGIRVVAGAAGLARQLAVVLAGERTPSTGPERCAGPVLVVAASQHPAMAAQVAVLEEAGVTVVRPTPAMLDGDDPDPGPVLRELEHGLRDGEAAVLTTAGLGRSSRGAGFVASTLAGLAASLAERGLVGGLVLTGGDVAAAVIERLGTREIVLGGEVQPAIPWGVLHADLLPAVPVVTKAGSFGAPSLLAECIAFLRASPGEG